VDWQQEKSNIEKYQVQHSSNGANFTDIAGAVMLIM
jgi:hypothetical protein